jgi:ubiquinone/menaquinone biosynthesis C-methylase UbiE
MSKFTDSQYLKNDQYRDSSNLDARVILHQRFSTNPYGWFRWVFDHLETLPESARVLELGCGHAHLWKENADRIPVGWNVTLSDFSPGMVDAAWRNLIVTSRAFKFEEVDAQSIPYEAETFDAVIANHMLYHLSDRPKALAEIKRVLKPIGSLFATTVGEGHLKEMNAWLMRVSEDRLSAVFHLPFLLENGAEQLQAFFDRVTMDRYSDNLEVTEIEPIFAYIRSGFSSGNIMDAELAKLQLELELELEQKGKISISKDSGLFTAVKEE